MPAEKLPPWIIGPDGRWVYTISGDDPWEPQLTPGADLAKRKGCTCSRLDNHWGVGITIWAGDGEADIEFVVTPGCPLHDTRSDIEDVSHMTITPVPAAS